MKVVGGHFAPVKVVNLNWNWVVNLTGICNQGPNYVLVQPTNHDYNIKNGELTIDFSIGCYGFENDVITYIKQ